MRKKTNRFKYKQQISICHNVQSGPNSESAASVRMCRARIDALSFYSAHSWPGLFSRALCSLFLTTNITRINIFSSLKKSLDFYLGGILETIGQTPVVKIQNLLPQADADRGVKIYAKCEFFNPLSSVKDRLALGIITGTVFLRCLTIRI